MKNYLGIDIGGSKLLIGILDESGNILEKQHSLLPYPITETILLQKIEEIVSPLLKRHLPIAGGVAIPGLANSSDGIWQNDSFPFILKMMPISVPSENMNMELPEKKKTSYG